jgi:hypothetical protein
LPYKALGWRSATGAKDTTGFNSNKWTVAFTPQVLNVSVQIPQFEIYKLILTGAAQTANFDVYVDNGHWDTNVYAAQNSWEPSGGTLIMTAGQTLYFYYSSLASDGNTPKITAWLRYDVALTDIFAGGAAL